MNLDEQLTLGREAVDTNLDLEEEREEGKTAAIPQLMRALEAAICDVLC